jgi:hypothetical protein
MQGYKNARDKIKMQEKVKMHEKELRLDAGGCK